MVTNLDPNDTVPECAINDAEGVYKVMRSQIDVVLPSGVGVLNADDAEVADMARLCDGEVIFFSENPNSEVIKTHLQNDGRAVLVGKQQITLKSGKLEQKNIPVPHYSESTSASPWRAMNLGAAIAAAWALEIPFNVIEAGAETFVTDTITATGV